MATIGIGNNALYIDALSYLAVTTSSDAKGTIALPGKSILQVVNGANTYTYGGYSSKTEVVVNLTQGSLTTTFSQVVPQNATKTSTLSSDYTLTAADDGTWFTASTALVVTVPAGLTPMPSCVFIPPASGSITLRSSGGTKLSGATSDIVVNLSTNPAGAGLVPLYGQTDSYGVTIAATGWSSLTGNPTDSTAFNTWAAGYQTVAAAGNKQSANYTLSSADHAGYIWLAAQATDKTFTLPSTLPNNFRCRIGYINSTAAAGRLKLTISGTSFVWTTNQSTGALQTGNNIFMGTASSNCIAVADVYHEGSAPGNTFTIAPVCGVFATA